MKTKESILTEKIIKWLRDHGYYAVKLHGSAMQQAGLPDVLAMKGGRTYFFEVKTEEGKATRLQAATIERLREFGAMAWVVRSVADVEEYLVGATP